ncbi:MAG: class I SAM-dependent methyltransferase, partial [Betaproteobacteria bacterium]
MSDLVFTGERFLPELRGEIWLEHWHRYHFAAPLGENRRVLDVASGEGYGSAMLALAALSVTGLDASAGAVAHARTVYGHLSNLQFVCGDCAALPFADGSFDVVVSFETIEHIAAQREFLGEVR